MTLVKMELLAQRRICDTCGSALDAEMLSGFCPGCLLNTVLETETETSRPEVALTTTSCSMKLRAAEWALCIEPGSEHRPASSR